MRDDEIVELLFQRNEEGLAGAGQEYGKYIRTICSRFLKSPEDAAECENDVLMRLWRAIPPHRPACLKAFIAKLTRNEALKRLDYDRAEKRGGGKTCEALDELLDFLDTGKDEDIADRLALTELINGFLESLSADDRVIFVKRYWYAETVGEIAADLRASQSRVKVSLFRSRNRLKARLEAEGYE